MPIQRNVHDAVVVQKQAFQALHEGETIDFTHVIVAQIDRIKLIHRPSQILNRGDFVPCMPYG